MAWPLKLKNSLVPSHLDWMLTPSGPPLMEISLKNVASKASAAASVINARPKPRSRSESSANTTATPAARSAPTRPPMRRFRPRWFASWAAVKAPTPARVAWQSESCPAMPVMSVMESRTIEYVSPLLKTVSHESGIQVSMDTKKTANRIHQSTRMIRFMLGARAEAAMGGGGGSIVARGSRLASSARIPGRKSSATTKKMKGSEGRIVE